MDEELRAALEVYRAAKTELDTATREAAQLKARLTLEIAGMKTPEGKAQYSNDASRDAALLLALGQEPAYQREQQARLDSDLAYQPLKTLRAIAALHGADLD